MFEKLKHIQEKPKSVRKKYALSISIFVTVVVMLIWVSTLSIDVKSSPVFIQRTNDPEERYGNLASIYFNIKKGIEETFFFIKKGF
jgi:hypothetical protein